MNDQDEQERYRYLQLKAKAAGTQHAAPGQGDWKQVIGKVAKDSFMVPMAAAKDLATNPVTMAKALPPLAGMAGAMSPIPGGATLGTVVGRQLSNLALKGLGKGDQIPSGWQQAGEAGLSALGDIAAIPMMKKGYYGGMIGEAESKYPGMAGVVKEAPPSGMRTAVKFIQGLKAKDLTILEAKQFKPAVDTIFQKGWLRGTPYEPDAVLVSQKIQSALNQVPGRGVASAGMARAMTIPRNINQLYQKLPPAVRRGLGYGTGVGLAGGAAVELIRKLMGD
jgi:hypothetical protein